MSGYLCPTCYRPIRFVAEYQRWYCDQCRQYPTYSVPAPPPSGAVPNWSTPSAAAPVQSAPAATPAPAPQAPAPQAPLPRPSAPMSSAPPSVAQPAAATATARSDAYAPLQPEPAASQPTGTKPAPLSSAARSELGGDFLQAARLYGEEGDPAARIRCLSALAHNLEAEGDLESAATTHEEAGSADESSRVRVQIAAESAARPVCPKCGGATESAKELSWCPACGAFAGLRRARWAPAFEFASGGSVRCVSVATDGSMIVLGSADRHVYALDGKGALLWKHETGDRVGRVAISGYRNVVVAGSADRYLYMFDGSGGLQARVPVPSPVCAVATTADGYLIASGSEKDLLVFDRQGHKLWKQSATGFITDVSMAAGGSIVAAVFSDGSLHCFDRTGNPAWNKSFGSLADASTSGDATVIACISDDGSLNAMDQNGASLFREKVDDPGFRDAQHYVKVSHDGSLVAAASGRVVAVFDRSGRRLMKYTAPHRLSGLAVSGDGRFIAAAVTPSASEAGEVKKRGFLLVFDRGGRLAWRDEAGGAPFRVSLSQDAATLACGSEDEKVRAFRLVSEQVAIAAATEQVGRAKALVDSGDREAGAAVFDELGLTIEAAKARTGGASVPVQAAADATPQADAGPPPAAPTDPLAPAGRTEARVAASPVPSIRIGATTSPATAAETPGRQAAFERYRRAVRRAIEDDRIIDDKERGFLDDLREAWGIDQLTAARIEEEQRREFQLKPLQVERVARTSPDGAKLCAGCGKSNAAADSICAKCGLAL